MTSEILQVAIAGVVGFIVGNYMGKLDGYRDRMLDEYDRLQMKWKREDEERND